MYSHATIGDGLRSPYVHFFSGVSLPVNVQGRLSAASLATLAPGRENRHFVVHSPYVVCLSGRGRACRPSPPPASLRADPVSRQRLIDFHAGPTASLRFSAFQVNSFRCKKSKPQRWSGVDGSGRKLPTCFRKAGRTRRDAGSGRAKQGC